LCAQGVQVNGVGASNGAHGAASNGAEDEKKKRHKKKSKHHDKFVSIVHLKTLMLGDMTQNFHYNFMICIFALATHCYPFLY